MYMRVRAPRVPVFCGCLRFERIGRQEIDLRKPDWARFPPLRSVKRKQENDQIQR